MAATFGASFIGFATGFAGAFEVTAADGFRTTFAGAAVGLAFVELIFGAGALEVKGGLALDFADLAFNDTDFAAAVFGGSLVFFLVIAFYAPSAVTFAAAIDSEISQRPASERSQPIAPATTAGHRAKIPRLRVPFWYGQRYPDIWMSLILCRLRGSMRRLALGDRVSKIANFDGTHHVCPAREQ